MSADDITKEQLAEALRGLLAYHVQTYNDQGYSRVPMTVEEYVLFAGELPSGEPVERAGDALSSFDSIPVIPESAAAYAAGLWHAGYADSYSVYASTNEAFGQKFDPDALLKAAHAWAKVHLSPDLLRRVELESADFPVRE